MADSDIPSSASVPNAKIDADEVSRIIMLIYGKMETGAPFWCYVAVKPSRFEAFKQAESQGEINLYEFSEYGEVIVSAEGQSPPEDVTLKVAEMYGADPSTFFQPIDPIKTVEEKMREWEKNPPQN